LISRHLTNKQIAGRLRVSEHTVKVHVRHILAKLDARGRSEISAVMARR
jgi:DNA-binding CsgD family transcriptional regulator